MIAESKPVCVVTGVGEGTGHALVRKFADQGYVVAMLSRNVERLAAIRSELGDDVHAYPCDLADLTALEGIIGEVRTRLGSPRVVVHNAVRATFEPLMEGDVDELEKNFRVNTTSLAHLAKAYLPDMVNQGGGAIVATGNTAAYRGVPSYALFAPTKAAQRIFLEALARQFGPQGIHAAYVNIDAVVDVPWTRDRFAADKPDEYFISPDSIADEVYHVVQQPRDSWSFNVEIRPFGERW